MSNRKKVLIWLVIIGSIIFLANADLSRETWTSILSFTVPLALFLYIRYEIKTLEIDKICQSINKRFRLIEHRIGCGDSDEKSKIAKPVAYKIQLGLLPHWEKILEKLAEQNEQKPDDFIEEILNDKELGIKKREGLFGKYFWFDIYQDEFSGIRQVWSRHHKALGDSWSIKGFLFEPWPRSIFYPPPEKYKKYIANYVSQYLTLAPHFARFDWLNGQGLFPAKNDVFKGGKIAKIPYYDIIQLLLEIGKGFDVADNAIQQFPKELQKRLEESNIRYDNEPYSFQDYGTEFDVSKDEDFDRNESGRNDEQWFKDRGIKLYQEKVDSHVFHTPHYSVSISLMIFEPPHLPYRR